jgi:hypothetical protein
VNRGTSTLALTLAAAVTLTGCGAKAHTPVTPAAPVTAAAPNAVTTGPAAAGTSAGAGTGTGTGKACSAGHTRATINGTVKCLAPGQQCSAKATTQYPQYGYICRTVNGRLVLHRA